MATSAAQLATLLDAITKEYKLDSEEVLGFLADKELLPKKLLPKSVKAVNLFASKKAEEVALEYHFKPDGATGSGKDGKWTVKDVEKAVQKPVATKVLVSPTALVLANEHKLDITTLKGTGQNGRILVKDVEAQLAAESDEEDELNISPRAQQEADKKGISKSQLANIHGSGKEGRILLDDVKKFGESSDDEEE